MDRHGLASWHVIDSALRTPPSCPKLRSYWHFHDCRYNKSRFTCAEPDHIDHCSLPRSWLRNGRLNQTAYSLYLRFGFDHGRPYSDEARRIALRISPLVCPLRNQ
jgi:hypothetical protein